MRRSFRATLAAILLLGLLSTACATMIDTVPDPTPLATAPPTAGHAGPSALTAVPTIQGSPVSAPPPPASAPGDTPSPSPASMGGMAPTPTALPPTAGSHVTNLIPPLLVDSAGGRLYIASGDVEPPRIAILSAADGRLLARSDIWGPFAFDPEGETLYVDLGLQGLAVLDASTGRRLRDIPVPGSHGPNGDVPVVPPAPQMTDGGVLVFRGHRALLVDPLTGDATEKVTAEGIETVGCGGPQPGVPPVAWARYDGASDILFLGFTTYACTPWVGTTIVSYDLSDGQEVARQGYDPFQAAAHDGYLYGASFYRMGVGYRWTWHEGEPGQIVAGWSGNAPRLQVDAPRQRIYEATGESLRVRELGTLDLLFELPQPLPGNLAGYDPSTDQLYFVDDGQLGRLSGSEIDPPAPESPLPVEPPASPVRSFRFSPNWTVDRTLYATWQDPSLDGDCWVSGASGGPFRISRDSGNSWLRPVDGLRAGGECVSAFAVSAGDPYGQTLLAGVVGRGVFRSTDGGASWEPSNGGLTSVAIDQIVTADDGTVFANTDWGELHRSSDGGRSWQPLGVDLGPIAISAEFEEDRTLMGVAARAEGPTLRVSRDGGDSWETVSAFPAETHIEMLSLAPLFERWGVAFAFDSTRGTLYRSADGGQTWAGVLHVGGRASAQIAYAPDIEVNRPVFLSVTTGQEFVDPQAWHAALYRSDDGGLTWEEMGLPDGVQPVTIGISPDFTHDGLLFVGTVDGKVSPWPAQLLAP